MQPIFFLVTRSFWATVAGLAVVLGAGEPVIAGVAAVLDPLLPWDAATITAWCLRVAPAVLWLYALRERGATGLRARPYTLNPRALK